MIHASCHCGAVKLEVPSAPENVASCNCSICSKIGVLWSYYSPKEVQITTPRENIDTYIWGDKMLQFCRCKTCGCTTHWESILDEEYDRMGVNARMMSGIDLENIPLRKIDGASN